MKVLLLIFVAQIASAGEIECITQVIYREARGVSSEEMAMVGHTILNEQKRTGDAVCRIASRNYQRQVPDRITYPLYRHIAHGVISGEVPDLTKGADHFNEGKKPRWAGRITRVTRHFVFYKLEKPA